MRSFTLSGAHRRAMPRLIAWCDEAALAHWVAQETGLPTWKEAYQQLIARGRPSKVKHPSAEHLAHQIPEPKVATTLKIRSYLYLS